MNTPDQPPPLSTFRPWQYHPLSDMEADIVKRVYGTAGMLMADHRFDYSHDFNHVIRVVALAIRIMEKEPQFTGHQPYDALTVILGALLHDSDDQKYRFAQPGNDCVLHTTDSRKYREFMPDESMVAYDGLLQNGVDEPLAFKVQTLVNAVSYSSEIKNPQRVQKVLMSIPELGVVQDADRLDAMGAIGIGRMFTFGASNKVGDMDQVMAHVEEKLLKLELTMKTNVGRHLAAIYTARLREFKGWWDSESMFASTLPWHM